MHILRLIRSLALFISHFKVVIIFQHGRRNRGGGPPIFCQPKNLELNNKDI